MQYVRSISGSVSATWKSINPATLSGAIDVVVVEREDGSLACSPFHVRFGKFQLLRPSDKKVEFTVNDEKRPFPMKVGEGGEAFFVFETTDAIPQSLQTSPVISPTASPQAPAVEEAPSMSLQDPEPLDITNNGAASATDQFAPIIDRPKSADGTLANLRLPGETPQDPFRRLSAIDKETLYDRAVSQPPDAFADNSPSDTQETDASNSTEEFQRAMKLSKKLWNANVPTIISKSGNLMLDLGSIKGGEAAALTAEGIARRILSEDLEEDYDIGSLIGMDDKGQVWIYSSEQAKEAADRKSGLRTLNPTAFRSTDAISDPGYHSDDNETDSNKDNRSDTSSPEPRFQPAPTKAYAKTLRLTHDQLKSLNLKTGINTMKFEVNKATCSAYLYFWRHDVPIVISDIDGTITKSDALGHVLNMIGRDWTHQGVAKLYTDIVANGYNILYLTSRSVGQADTTRGYLNGVQQDGYKLPKGPVILSPDRTMAALRREVYLRKPEVFKMACLRDIMNLFSTDSQLSEAQNPDSKSFNKQRTPFYAGFGNRLTDALSYRSVSIPPTRIFTINSYAEVQLYLLTLNSYRTSYLTIWELVDHYFPPVGLLIKDGGEEYTDFNYWRDRPGVIDFSDSEGEDDDDDDDNLSDEDLYDEDRPFIIDDASSVHTEDMEASYLSHNSFDTDQKVLDTVEEDYEDQEDDRIEEYSRRRRTKAMAPETIAEHVEEEEDDDPEADHNSNDIDDPEYDNFQTPYLTPYLESRSLDDAVMVHASQRVNALNLAADEEPEEPAHAEQLPPLAKAITANPALDALDTLDMQDPLRAPRANASDPKKKEVRIAEATDSQSSPADSPDAPDLPEVSQAPDQDVSMSEASGGSKGIEDGVEGLSGDGETVHKDKNPDQDQEKNEAGEKGLENGGGGGEATGADGK